MRPNDLSGIDVARKDPRNAPPAQHTQEPWESGGIPVSNADDIKRELLSDLQQAIDSHTGSLGDHVMVIYRHDSARIAYLVGSTAEQNCDRIVACVNACAGVDNETLVKIAKGEMTGSEIWELAQVKQQHAELLDTLKRIANPVKYFHIEYPEEAQKMSGLDMIYKFGSAAYAVDMANKTIAKERGNV